MDTDAHFAVKSELDSTVLNLQIFTLASYRPSRWSFFSFHMLIAHRKLFGLIDRQSIAVGEVDNNGKPVYYSQLQQAPKEPVQPTSPVCGTGEPS